MYSKNAWEKYSEQEFEQVMKFNEDYKDFISKGKTERKCVELAVKDVYLASGTNTTNYDKGGDRLTANTKIGKVLGVARNAVIPNGVTKAVANSDTTVNAFSYITDCRSEQYATKQDLINANKNLSSFNSYWDTTSGAPVWRTLPVA